MMIIPPWIIEEIEKEQEIEERIPLYLEDVPPEYISEEEKEKEERVVIIQL